MHSHGGPPYAGRPRRKFCGKHCFYIVPLTLVSIFALLLLIASAAFPSIAQRAMRQTDIEVQWVKMKEPGSTTFLVDQYSTLAPFYKLRATVGSMKLEISKASNTTSPIPFAEIVSKDMDVGNTRGITVVDQEVKITNLTEYQSFTNIVLFSEKFKVRMRGKARVRWGILYAQTNIDKEVELKGLNGLKDFNLLSAKFMMNSDPDGTNFIGVVNVPNPSALSAVTGNVTVKLTITGTEIGNATIINGALKPGNNTLHLRAQINPLSMLDKKEDLMKGTLVIDSEGISSIYNGEHVDFIEKAFTNNVFHTTFDVLSNIDSVSIVNSTGGESKVMDIVTGQADDPEMKGLLSAFMGTGGSGNSSSSGLFG